MSRFEGMRGRLLCTGIALPAWLILGLCGSPAYPLPQILEPADIVPGVHGTAHTVFQGEEPRPFAVELLGVMTGSSPKGELILFRALDDSLQHTGVVQGMSGSPVYVDDKLVGAIAYAFPFSKEPIGLITPIGEMLEGLSRAEEPPGPWMGAPTADHESWRELFLTRDNRPELWDQWRPAAAHAGDTPNLIVLSATGWSPEMDPILGRFARSSGLPAPTSGGMATGPVGEGAPLRPGSAVAVRLIDGDASLAAIGTVTHREGDRLIAFGHPLFQAGPVELPMSSAWINTIIPSYNTPFKMGSAGEVIGTVRQDLRSGITGIVGPIPRMLPARIVLDGPAGRAVYHYRLARGLLLEPSLLVWITQNSFLQHGWRIGQATFDATLKVHYNGDRLLIRSERMTSRFPANDLAQRLLLPVPMLLSNPFETVDLDSVVLEVSYDTDLSETNLVELSAGRVLFHTGEEIQLSARLADRQGATRTVTTAFEIPERWAGRSLLILAGGLEELTEWERDRAPSLFEPQDLGGLERLVRDFPREGDLLVRIYSEEVGVMLGDRELGPLPGSITRVLGSQQKRGLARQALNPMLIERRIDVEATVYGGSGVRVRIE